MIVPHGLLPPVLRRVSLLVRIILVVVLFCTVPRYLLLTPGLMWPAIFSSVSSPSMISHFMFAVYMPLTTTLIETSSLKTFRTGLILLAPTLVAGDLNTVFDRSKDCCSSDPHDSSRESSARLAPPFDACCLVDIWQYLHPDVTSLMLSPLVLGCGS